MPGILVAGCLHDEVSAVFRRLNTVHPVQLKASASSGEKSQAGRALRQPGDDAMVQEIGTRVLRAMVSQSPTKGTYMGHIKPEKWEFVVLDDPEANACALPGGKVVVNTGAESRLLPVRNFALTAHDYRILQRPRQYRNPSLW